jgi:hypothetical protein
VASMGNETCLIFQRAHRKASVSIDTMGHVDIDIYATISMVLGGGECQGSYD